MTDLGSDRPTNYHLFDELARYLTWPTRQAVLDRLKVIAQGNELRETLISASDDSLFITKVAESSYAHPGGFDKLVLYGNSRMGKLRIHLWPGRGLEREADVHNHFWSFSSVVLAGELISEMFVPDPTGNYAVEEYWLRRCECPDDFTLMYKGKAVLARSMKEHIKVAGIQSLDNCALHRVRSASHFPAATLVLQGPPRSKENRVYSFARKPRAAGREVIPHFSPEDVREKLIWLCEILSTQGSKF